MSEDGPVRYVVRVLPRAVEDIQAQQVRLAELAGPDIARAWREGLLRKAGTLSENPRRCARIPEQARFRYETRHLLYQRAPDGPTWRILFTITGEEERSPDPPTINLLHVRHEAQRPITQTEARAMEAQEE